MNPPWKHTALCICDAKILLAAANDKSATMEEYRAHLLKMRRLVDEALAELPAPGPIPEKAAGHVSESWRSGA